MSKIYVLIKGKHGKTSLQRITEICSTPLFDNLRNLDKDFMNRLHLIEGNVGELNLGISVTDREILTNNTQIIIHLAANVRFDAPLHEICLVNLRGTREMLKLANDTINIMSFIYVSTAYTHCYQKHIEEKFYNCPIDPHKMIQLSENSVSHIPELTTRFVSPWPNTYSFSKAVAEELIRLQGTEKFPTAIIRPSIGKCLYISTYIVVVEIYKIKVPTLNYYLM